MDCEKRLRAQTKLIALSQGKFAIVDADDYEQLAQFKWYALKDSKNDTFYAYRQEKRKGILMHRQILSAPAEMLCDHINHNGLDNRRANIRLCTNAQNQHNQRPHTGCSSCYKGVCWNQNKTKWQAYIRLNNRKYHLGCFDYEIDAALAYDDKAVELFGEFACLNFTHRPEMKQWLEDTYLFNPTGQDARLKISG